MATRCPNCNKFASFDNGDPEVNLEVEFDGDNFKVSGDVRLVRNCADCSETLKELTEGVSDNAALKAFEWKNNDRPFTPDGLEAIVRQLRRSSPHALSIEAGEANFNEVGSKNRMIEVVIPYTITIELDSGIEGHYNGDLKLANSAGSYEECC